MNNKMNKFILTDEDGNEYGTFLGRKPIDIAKKQFLKKRKKDITQDIEKYKADHKLENSDLKEEPHLAQIKKIHDDYDARDHKFSLVRSAKTGMKGKRRSYPYNGKDFIDQESKKDKLWRFFKEVEEYTRIRYFAILDVETKKVHYGRYQGTSPLQAARKAYRQASKGATGNLYRSYGDKDKIVEQVGGENRFTIAEITRGRKQRQFTYSGRIEQLHTPHVVTIGRGYNSKQITYTSVTKVTRVRD